MTKLLHVCHVRTLQGVAVAGFQWMGWKDTEEEAHRKFIRHKIAHEMLVHSVYKS